MTTTRFFVLSVILHRLLLFKDHKTQRRTGLREWFPSASVQLPELLNVLQYNVCKGVDEFRLAIRHFR
ncbi:hypothetical protein, partial [Rossellomorea marisflavi]|uniref:hypothetical protein n=1 Tax=Rossellomorea marisflavi TaxID=189381 RepID=UPI00295F16C6